ncbi:hypothetical protein BU14_2111s0001 [Porphyra umbilicalis]|uniref:Uncharacterized protein n=1 Tax=Porphyra umbilicalis TaxID=2786 RepID=A0A1X6NKA3_PORUM|nr:hypothetical protein BU14_2111s0001 [Porphyra umbilicalis]|eukprot:OSX68906.1 hypothetical protein BU14_2111s0001 [Porphyra umbilicalis]
MNTKRSVAAGWAAYASAVAVGASYGYYRYMYGPGGRAERQAAADAAFAAQEAADQEHYTAIRAERTAAAEAAAAAVAAAAEMAGAPDVADEVAAAVTGAVGGGAAPGAEDPAGGAA